MALADPPPSSNLHHDIEIAPARSSATPRPCAPQPVQISPYGMLQAASAAPQLNTF